MGNQIVSIENIKYISINDSGAPVGFIDARGNVIPLGDAILDLTAETAARIAADTSLQLATGQRDAGHDAADAALAARITILENAASTPGSGAPAITSEPTISTANPPYDVGELLTIVPGTKTGTYTTEQFRIIVNAGSPSAPLVGLTFNVPVGAGGGSLVVRQELLWGGGFVVSQDSVVFAVNAPLAVPEALSPPTLQGADAQGVVLVGGQITIVVPPMSNSPTSLALRFRRSSLTGTLLATKHLATVTMTIASPCVVTTPFDFADGTQLTLSTTGALPTGLSTGVQPFWKRINATTGNLALTAGGASINTSGTQSGVHTVAETPSYPTVAGDAGTQLVGTVQGTNADGTGAEVASTQVTVAGTSGASLSAQLTFGQSVATIDVAALGDAYWEVFEGNDAGTLVRKSGAVDELTFVAIAPGAMYSGGDWPYERLVAFSGGDPIASGTSNGVLNMYGPPGSQAEMTVALVADADFTVNVLGEFPADAIRVDAVFADASATIPQLGSGAAVAGKWQFAITGTTVGATNLVITFTKVGDISGGSFNAYARSGTGGGAPPVTGRILDTDFSGLGFVLERYYSYDRPGTGQPFPGAYSGADELAFTGTDLATGFVFGFNAPQLWGGKDSLRAYAAQWQLSISIQLRMEAGAAFKTPTQVHTLELLTGVPGPFGSPTTVLHHRANEPYYLPDQCPYIIYPDLALPQGMVYLRYRFKLVPGFYAALGTGWRWIVFSEGKIPGEVNRWGVNAELQPSGRLRIRVTIDTMSVGGTVNGQSVPPWNFLYPPQNGPELDEGVWYYLECAAKFANTPGGGGFVWAALNGTQFAYITGQNVFDGQTAQMNRFMPIVNYSNHALGGVSKYYAGLEVWQTWPTDASAHPNVS